MSNWIFISKGGQEPLKSIIQYTAEDFKILDGLEDITLENFQAKYETIEQLIIAQNMGKEANEPLKNQLVSLKTKLIKELSKKLGKKGCKCRRRIHCHRSRARPVGPH